MRRADRYGDRTTRILRFSVLLIATFASGQAMAQQAEDPEALIREGIELRRQGDDLRAEGYFKRAYQIAHTPRSMAQLGLVELAIGDYMAAELYLTNALAGEDAWIRSYQKTLEDSRLSARGHLMQVVVTDARPGTSAAVEKEPRVELHLDGVLWLNPGPTIVVFEAAGYQPNTMTIRGEPGAIQRITVGFVRSQDASSAGDISVADARPRIQTVDASNRSASGRQWMGVGIGVCIAGAAVGGLGTALLIVGNSRRDDIESSSGAMKRYNPSDGDWNSLQHDGIGLMIGGAVALAGGATLILLGHHETTASDKVSLLPTVSRTGVGVMGRF
jgi:hypothetical protein